MYSYQAKNTGQDTISYNRLRIIENLGFNYNLTSQRYSYCMKAELGIIIS